MLSQGCECLIHGPLSSVFWHACAVETTIRKHAMLLNCQKLLLCAQQLAEVAAGTAQDRCKIVQATEVLVNLANELVAAIASMLNLQYLRTMLWQSGRCDALATMLSNFPIRSVWLPGSSMHFGGA